MKTKRPTYIDFAPEDWDGVRKIGFDIVELKLDGIMGRLVLSGTADTHIIGEFIVGSQWAKDESGILGKFVAFDILRFQGHDLYSLSWKKRRAILDDQWGLHNAAEKYEIYSRTGKVKSSGNNISEILMSIDPLSIDEMEELWEDQVMGNGIEGLVFKRRDGDWMENFGRMKRVYTMDYVCLGFNKSDASSKPDEVKSIQGGIYVDGKLAHVCDIGGITRSDSKEMFAHPSKFIGGVFEATGKGLFKSGALRHPNFLKMRDDKTAIECVLPSSV